MFDQLLSVLFQRLGSPVLYSFGLLCRGHIYMWLKCFMRLRAPPYPNVMWLRSRSCDHLAAVLCLSSESHLCEAFLTFVTVLKVVQDIKKKIFLSIFAATSLRSSSLYRFLTFQLLHKFKFLKFVTAPHGLWLIIALERGECVHQVCYQTIISVVLVFYLHVLICVSCFSIPTCVHNTLLGTMWP